MYLENISLVNFKNYEQLKITFSKQVNCLIGDNGSGKTNLLDAIYYLALTKSSLNFTDLQCVRHQQGFFTVKGTYKVGTKTNKVQMTVMRAKKKIIKENDVPLEKNGEHIGKYPVTLISPTDTDLIHGGSELRRKYFDSILCQIDAEYLQWLMKYNHTLKQRNALLKQIGGGISWDKTIFEIYDDSLIGLGIHIYRRRKAFIDNFLPVFKEKYTFIADSQEESELLYESDFVTADYANCFRQSFEKDVANQRTCFGIHRDDYNFQLSELPIKKFGSQGQQKSFVIALKLAQFELMSKEKGYKPILLLDDIFDKLDDKRIAHLLHLLSDEAFGQVFITDARPERTRHFIKPLAVDKKLLYIEDGTLTEAKW